MLDCSVVIVNFRTEERVERLVRRLAASGDERPARIVVVDNGSDGSLRGRLEDCELPAGLPVELLEMERNLGFAGAVNRGLDRCEERVVLLLNPDARPEPGCLAGLVEALEEDRAWVAAPALAPMREGEPELPSATLTDPGIRSLLVENTIAHRAVGRDWLERRYFLRAATASESLVPVDCASVQGACFAIRHDAFEAVGGFDDTRFFLYWEETDFCRRVRKAGGRVLFCPKLRCRHEGGASTAGLPTARLHFWRGLYRYQRKHGSLARVAFLWLLLSGGIAAEAVVLGLLDVTRRGRDAALRRDLGELVARLRLQLDVLRGGGSA